jgi:hypothetical protein
MQILTRRPHPARLGDYLHWSQFGLRSRVTCVLRRRHINCVQRWAMPYALVVISIRPMSTEQYEDLESLSVGMTTVKIVDGRAGHGRNW